MSRLIAYPRLSARSFALLPRRACRLYHQLTEALLAFARDPRNGRGDNLLQLYEHVVAPNEGRLSQLRVVQLVGAVAAQMCPSRPYVVEGAL